MKKIILLFAILLSSTLSYSQLKTGNNPKSITSNTYFEVESVDGSKTVIKKDSGQVGIGNTTPLHRLVVRGLNKQPSALGTNRSNAIVRIEGESNHSLDFGTFANSPYGSYIQSYNKASTGTLPLVLNPMAGNVGIWNSNPSAPLDVLSTYGEVARFTTSATGSTYGGIALGNNSGSWAKLAAGEGVFQIRNFTNDTVVLHSDLVTKKVGIGTISPTNRLHISDTANPIKIDGLKTGLSSDSVITIDNSGVVRKLESSAMAIAHEPWFNVATNKGANANTQNIYQMGNVGIGTATPSSILNIESTTGNIINTRYASTVGLGANLILQKSASNTLGTNEAIQNNDVMGRLVWKGNQGSGYNSASSAEIRAQQVGTASTTNNGSKLFFSTTKLNSTNYTDRMVIADSGFVGINTTNPLNLLSVKGTNSQPSANGLNQTSATFRVDGNSNHALDMGTLNNTPYGSYIQSQNKTANTGIPLSLNPSGGNVGINTLAPNAPLEVLSSGIEVARMTSTLTGTSYGGIALGNNTGAWTKLASGEGKFQIRNFTNDTIVFHADLVTKNIGLGTVNPTHKLEINSGTAGASGVKITQLSSNISSTSTAGTALLGIDASGVVVPVGSSKRMESIATNATFDVNINTFASYKVTIAGSEDAANGYKTFADEYLVTYANNFTKLSVVQVAGVHSNLGAQVMKSGYSTNSVVLAPDHTAYNVTFSVAGSGGVITTKALRGLAIISVKTISLW